MHSASHTMAAYPLAPSRGREDDPEDAGSDEDAEDAFMATFRRAD